MDHGQLHDSQQKIELQ